MELDLKYKIGTTIAIDRQKVLHFFSPYIDSPVEGATVETYTCREGSLLILLPSGIKENVFVQFHLNLNADPQNPEGDLEGKIWFMQCCKQYGSEIKNLRSGEILPVSDGAIMSDLFSTKAYRIASHFYNNPKDKQVKGESQP